VRKGLGEGGRNDPNFAHMNKIKILKNKIKITKRVNCRCFHHKGRFKYVM
jgi:hypothetical protein